MTRYDIAEAQACLSELVRKAMLGDEVVIAPDFDVPLADFQDDS